MTYIGGDVGKLVGQSVGRSVGQSVGRSVGQSVSWSAGWLVGWSFFKIYEKIPKRGFMIITGGVTYFYPIELNIFDRINLRYQF